MLTRIEIAAGVAVLAVVCILAGYAMVSGILLVRPDDAVRSCVERAEAAAPGTRDSGSRLRATETCEKLIHGTNIIP